MGLKEKLKAKLNLKKLLSFKASAKALMMVKELESMMERGDVVGILKLAKPYIEKEGFDMQIIPHQEVEGEYWAAVCLLRKHEEVKKDETKE